MMLRQTSSTVNSESNFPNLLSLGLDEEDLLALASQGFLNIERRGQNVYYKLRFRRNGQQRVHYVGSEQKAVAVRQELELLQNAVKRRAKIRKLQQLALRTSRQARQQLAPVLEKHNIFFHGIQPRKRRVVKQRSKL
jgi:hypothetical protein